MLQQTLTGGAAGTGAQEILRKLDRAIEVLERGVKRPAPVNPSELARVIAAREERRAELAQARAEVAEFEAARKELEEAQEKMRAVEERLSEAEALLERAGRVLDLERKAGELGKRVDDLANRLELVKKLEEEIAALEEGLAKQTQVDVKTAQEVAGWVERMRERTQEQGKLRDQIAEDEGRIGELEAQLREASKEAGLRETLERVRDLEARVEAERKEAEDLAQRASELAGRIGELREQSRRTKLLVAAGLVAVVVGGLGGLKLAALFALAAVGLALLVVAWLLKPTENWRALETQRAELERTAERAQAAATEHAAESAALLSTVGCGSVEQLEGRVEAGETRARELQAKLDAARGAVQSRREQLAQVEDVLQALQRKLADVLRKTNLESAEELIEQAQAREAAQKELEQRRAKRDGALGGETAEELEERRRELSREWRSFLDELESPELQYARMSPEKYQELRTRVETLKKEGEVLAQTAARAERRMAACRADWDLVRALEGEVEALEERERLLQERLETWHIAREAIAEASEEVLASATEFLKPRMGQLLGRLTGQRYEQVLLDSNMSPAIVVPQTAETVVLDGGPAPLSVATREQVFFAARLALVDMLWPQGGPPLLLDDPLVNFDATRRAAAVEVIAEIAQTHQVILFTCGHEYDEVAERLIALPGPSETQGGERCAGPQTEAEG
jgi:DNA repair exonuclease SbcCD ATPase subunit